MHSLSPECLHVNALRVVRLEPDLVYPIAVHHIVLAHRGDSQRLCGARASTLPRVRSARRGVDPRDPLRNDALLSKRQQPVSTCGFPNNTNAILLHRTSVHDRRAGYSLLSAITGSTRKARRAGTYAPISATTINNMDTVKNVAGSCGVTPKSMLETTRELA
jgi:hypothetical protein